MVGDPSQAPPLEPAAIVTQLHAVSVGKYLLQQIAKLNTG